MLAEQLIPDDPSLELGSITVTDEMITVELKSTQPEALCPHCHQPSRRIHSRYPRRLADLSWAGKTVRLHLQARRFFCTNPICPRAIFAERLLGVVRPWARRTSRLPNLQQQCALMLGGEAGARVTEQLGITVSPDTILRLVRRTPPASSYPVRVLGVDDWAWRKGSSYGTILIDLEQHRVIDLLPDRSAQTLTVWLRERPDIKIITRDRAGAYAEGARRGAPQAIQVADRWHLLANLRTALERLLLRHHTLLPPLSSREAHSLTLAPLATRPQNDRVTPTTSAPPVETSAAEAACPVSSLRAPTRAERLHQARRARRLSRYEEVLRLHEQGVSIRGMARQLGMGRRTIRHYLAVSALPEITRRRRVPSLLDPFVPFLGQRWAAGCHNGLQLFREIRHQGYDGSRGLVSRWAARIRKDSPYSCRQPTTRAASSTRARPPAAIHSVPALRGVRRLSPGQAAWLLVREAITLTAQERAVLAQTQAASSEIATAYTLAQDFISLVRMRKAEGLAGWLQAAKRSGVTELRSFAVQIQRDESAVAAGLSLPWSNGQVEGQVNRLKVIKRQGYGRAKFDLLRQRVLYRAQGP